MTKPNAEQVYDAEIAPLMSKIIAICKENKIPMLADFAIGHADDEGLKCTTVIFGDGWELLEEMKQAEECIRPRKRKPLMVTVTKGDGSKEITAIL